MDGNSCNFVEQPVIELKHCGTTYHVSATSMALTPVSLETRLFQKIYTQIAQHQFFWF